jgi:DNA-binding transcriptional regulator YiaG
MTDWSEVIRKSWAMRRAKYGKRGNSVVNSPAPPTKGKGKCIAWLREHVAYRSDECLIWPFSRNPELGYGMFGLNGEMLYAHRWMCEEVNGPPPTPQHQAAHSCGRGHDGCVAPTHLRWKTISENLLDKRRHGTHAGGKGSRATLTAVQIEEIRAARGIESQYATARRFGVKRGTIQYWQKDNEPPAPPGKRRLAQAS